MTFWITTTSAARARLWQRLIGQDQLPVTSERPIDFRFGEERVTAYVLDATKLHPMTVRRVAGYIARQNGLSYETAVGMMGDGWLIPAEDCELVSEEVSGSPAFFLPVSHIWGSRLRCRQLHVRGDLRWPFYPYSTKALQVGLN